MSESEKTRKRAEGGGRKPEYPEAFKKRGLEVPDWAYEKERQREAAKEEAKKLQQLERENRRLEKIRLKKELNEKEKEIKKGKKEKSEELLKEVADIQEKILITEIEPKTDYIDFASTSIPANQYIKRDYYKKRPSVKKVKKPKEKPYRVKSKNGKIMYFNKGKLISKKKFMSLK